jgi:hypothetical protein
MLTVAIICIVMLIVIILNDCCYTDCHCANIWSSILELSIMILEALSTLINDAHSGGVTHDDRQLMIVICL